MSDFKIKVGATLEEGAISNLQNELNNIDALIKIKIDNSELNNLNLNNISKSIVSQMKTVGNQASKSFSNNFKLNLNFANSKQQINEVTKALKNMKIDDSSINNTINDLKNMEIQLASIKTSLNNDNLKTVNLSGIISDGSKVNVILKQLKDGTLEVNKNISSTFTQPQQAIEETKEKIFSLDLAIRKTKANIEIFKNNNNLSEDTTSKLDDVLDQLNVTKSINSLNLLKEKLSVIKSEAKAAGETGAKSFELTSDEVLKLNTKIAKLKADITSYLNTNTKLSSGRVNELNGIISSLSNISNTKRANKELQNLVLSFSKVRSEAKAAGETGVDFFDKFKSINTLLGGMFSSIAIFSTIRNELKEGFNSIVELDSAMIELKKVCEDTNVSFEGFYYKSNDIAKSLGQTTATVISMTADFAQMGYSLKEAMSLTETASKYATISPEMSTEQATNSLIATMKAYDIEAENALDGIASKVNYIGNSFAVTNSDVAEFMRRSASSMASANTSLDETLALGESITETTRDAANTGQLLKTVSARLRAINEESGLVDSSLQTVGADLEKIANVQVYNTDGSLRSMFSIMKDLSTNWDTFTDKQRGDIIETVAGKRYANGINALLSNFESAERALVGLQNSAGGADAEFEKASQSVEFKLNTLKETGTGIWQNVLDSESLKSGIDLLTNLLGVLDGVTSILNTLSSIPIVGNLFDSGTLVGGLAFGLSKVDFKSTKETFKSIISNKDLSTVGKMKSGISGLKESFSSAAIAAGKMIAILAAIQIAVEVFDYLVVTQKELKENAQDAANAVENSQKELDELNQKLESNNKKINELKSSGSLTFIEQSELDKLKESNKLLEQQKKIKEKEKKENQISSAMAASEAAEGTLKPGWFDKLTGTNWLKGLVDDDYLDIQTSDYDSLISKYQKLKEEKEEMLSSGKYDQGLIDNFSLAEEKLNSMISETNKYQEQMKDGYDILKTKESKGEYLSSSDKNVIKSFEENKKRIDEIYETIDSYGYRSIKFDEIFDTKNIEKTKEELLELQKVGKLKDLDLSQYKNLQHALEKSGISIEEFKEQFKAMSENDSAKIDLNQENIEKLNSSINITKDNILKLNTAIKDSNDIGGLSSEDITNVVSMFSDLDNYNYNDLFENTANGIQLNQKELAKLNEEYDKSKISDFNNQLEDLKKQYIDLNNEIGKTTDYSKRDSLIQQKEAIQSQINSVSQLKSEYQGLNNVVRDWKNSSSKGNAGDTYNSIQSGLKSFKENKSKDLIGSNEFTSYLQMFTNKNVSSLNQKETLDLYEEKLPLIEKYWTEGSKGCEEFLKKLHKINPEWAHFNKETQNWEINIPLEDVAKKLDIPMETLQTIIDKLKDYKFDIKVDDNTDPFAELKKRAKLSLEEIKDDKIEIELDNKTEDEISDQVDYINNKIKKIKEQKLDPKIEKKKIENYNNLLEYTKEKLADIQNSKWQIDIDSNIDELNKNVKKIKKLELIDEEVEINFKATDSQYIEKQIEKILENVEKVKNEDGTFNVNAKGAEEVRKILTALIQKKVELNNPAVMDIDTSKLSGDTQSAITQLQSIQDKINEIKTRTEISEKLGIEADISQLETSLASAINIFESQHPQIAGKLKLEGLTNEEFQEKLANLNAIAYVNIGVKDDAIKNYIPEEKNGEVNWKNNTIAVDNYAKETKKATGTVTWNNDINNVKNNFTANGTVNWNNTSPSPTYRFMGTAHNKGSINVKGNAYARGSWGVKNPGKSLVGELGTELIVRNGQFFTVGDKGAEFVDIKKDDIIFDHLQTEELLNGKNVANYFMKGSAFATSSTTTGNGSFHHIPSSIGQKKKRNTNKGNSNKKNTKKKNKSKDNEIETFDWVEVKIQRIQEAIERLDTVAGSVYQHLSVRNSKLTSEYKKVKSEIDIQQKAYNRYIKQANSIGLSSSYKKKVQDGKISIQDIKDEKLKKKIKSYQEWYEKAIKCKDSINELKVTLGDLEKEKFDNYATWYDNRIEKLENFITKIENTNDKNKYTKTIGSDLNNYNKISSYYIKITKELKSERAKLQKIMEEGLKNGSIKEGSEAHYEMYTKIQDISNNIIENETKSLEQYSNKFDEIIKKYENVTQKSENKKNRIETLMDLNKERGIEESSVYYKVLISTNQSMISNLEKEKNALRSSMIEALNNGYSKNSEEYKNMEQQLVEVDLEVLNLTKDIQEYNNTIEEISWERFDTLHEKISNIIDESEFLNGLFDNDKLYNDNGSFNNNGLSSVALHGINYNTYMKQAEEYKKAINDLDKVYKDDKLNIRYLERRQELVEIQRDLIQNAENEKQSIIDLKSEGYDILLNSLDKIIEKRKDLLDTQKDFYEFEKDIAEKTKEVSTIEKKLAAYNGDNSEESQKNIQQLKVELQEAKDNLKETEYDKYISDQEKILDELYNKAEEWVNNRLDNTDELLQGIITEVNSSTSTIAQTIHDKSDKVGYDISQPLNQMITKSESTNILLSTYNEKFSSTMASVIQTIETLKKSDNTNNKITDTKVNNSIKTDSKQSNNTLAIKKETSIKTNETKNKNTNNPIKQKEINNKVQNDNKENSSKKSIFSKLKFNGNKKSLNRKTSIVDALKYYDYNSSFAKRKDYYKKLGFGSNYTGSSSQNNKLLKEFRKIMGYSKGGLVGQLKKVAKINGDTGVSINTLTPGESVFDVKTTEQLIRFNKNADKFSDLMNYLGTNNSTQTIIQQSFDGMRIELPNVRNFNEFKNELFSDNDFRKFVFQTVDNKYSGKNKLSIKKYIK